MTGDQTRASEDAVHGESEQPMRSAATSDSGFDGALDETLSASGDTASGAPRKVPLPSLVDASLPASSVGTPTSPPRASSATRGVTRNSLGPGVEGLVLYDLTNAKGDKKEFSPHVSEAVASEGTASMHTCIYHAHQWLICFVRFFYHVDSV